MKMTEKKITFGPFLFWHHPKKQLINIIIIIVISSNETGKQQSLQKKICKKPFE